MTLRFAVAIPCSWLAMAMEKAKKQKEAVEALDRPHVDLRYDYEKDLPSIFPEKVPGPIWLRKLLGDDFFRTVRLVWCYDEKFTKEDLEHLGELKDLKQLTLLKVTIEDDGWKHLKGMKSLQYLSLEATSIRDTGLENLKELKNLQKLHLSKTQVTSAGLKQVHGLKDLQTLSLHRTKITDEGLESVEELHQLQSLYLAGTRITDSGLKKLERLKNLQNLSLGVGRSHRICSLDSCDRQGRPI